MVYLFKVSFSGAPEGGCEVGGSFVHKNGHRPGGATIDEEDAPQPPARHRRAAFLVETRLTRQPTAESSRVAISSEAPLVKAVWVRQEGSCVVRSRCVSPKMQKKKEHYVCE